MNMEQFIITEILTSESMMNCLTGWVGMDVPPVDEHDVFECRWI